MRTLVNEKLHSATACENTNSILRIDEYVPDLFCNFVLMIFNL